MKECKYLRGITLLGLTITLMIVAWDTIIKALSTFLIVLAVGIVCLLIFLVAWIITYPIANLIKDQTKRLYIHKGMSFGLVGICHTAWVIYNNMRPHDIPQTNEIPVIGILLIGCAIYNLIKAFKKESV